jgi:hypothetical protein
MNGARGDLAGTMAYFLAAMSYLANTVQNGFLEEAGHLMQ